MLATWGARQGGQDQVAGEGIDRVQRRRGVGGLEVQRQQTRNLFERRQRILAAQEGVGVRSVADGGARLIGDQHVIGQQVVPPRRHWPKLGHRCLRAGEAGDDGIGGRGSASVGGSPSISIWSSH